MLRCLQFCVFVAAVLFSSVAKAQTDEPSYDSLVRDLESSNAVKKMNAAAELTAYADKLDQFLIPLAKLFVDQDEQMRLIASRAFQRMGSKAVDELGTLLKSEDLTEFRMGCDAVHAIGDPAKAKWKELLIEKLDSSEVNVRVAAMHGLTGFSEGAPEAVDIAIEHLKDKKANFNVSLFACRLLIKTGPKAVDAVPELAELIETGNVSQRSYAAMALGAIGPVKDFDTLDVLGGMLDQFSYFERERGLTALGMYGTDARKFEDKVIEKMNQDGSNLEARAAFVLWQITGDANRSVEKLIEFSKRPEFEISALEFLYEMGPAAKSAADYLVKRLTSPDESVREAAVRALGRIDELSKDQLAALNNAAADPDPAVRMAAEIALDNRRK